MPTEVKRAAFCYKCGSRMEPDAFFCTECGTKVNDDAVFGGDADTAAEDQAASASSLCSAADVGKSAAVVMADSRKRHIAKIPKVLLVALIVAAMCGAAMAANYVYQKHYAPYRNATPIVKDKDKGEGIGDVISKKKKEVEKQVEKEAQERFEEWLEAWLANLLLTSCSSSAPTAK